MIRRERPLYLRTNEILLKKECDLRKLREIYEFDKRKKQAIENKKWDKLKGKK